MSDLGSIKEMINLFVVVAAAAINYAEAAVPEFRFKKSVV
uniref:Uncharacterized protein n=1 Tax=Rhodnius prolixus TaxID=13249 RepID=T1HJT0_RHOPR